MGCRSAGIPEKRPGRRPRDKNVAIGPCLVYAPLPLQVSLDPPRPSTQELKKTRRRRSVEEPPSNRALTCRRQPRIIFRKRPTTFELPVDRWMMTFSVVLVLKEELRRAAVSNSPGDLTRPRGWNDCVDQPPATVQNWSVAPVVLCQLLAAGDSIVVLCSFAAVFWLCVPCASRYLQI